MSIKSLNANINRRKLMKMGLLGGVAVSGLPPFVLTAAAQDLPVTELEKKTVAVGVFAFNEPGLGRAGFK